MDNMLSHGVRHAARYNMRRCNIQRCNMHAATCVDATYSAATCTLQHASLQHTALQHSALQHTALQGAPRVLAGDGRAVLVPRSAAARRRALHRRASLWAAHEQPGHTIGDRPAASMRHAPCSSEHTVTTQHAACDVQLAPYDSRNTAVRSRHRATCNIDTVQCELETMQRASYSNMQDVDTVHHATDTMQRATYSSIRQIDTMQRATDTMQRATDTMQHATYSSM
jgi:hypothetical protein